MVGGLPIVSGRLTLRLLVPDDLDDVYAYQGLASVARWLYRPPRTRDECADMITRVAAGTDWNEDGDRLVLGIVAPGSGVLGEIGLTLASARARQAEIGWLLHPAHEGHGYATEAAAAVAAYAFDVLGVHRLYARLDVLNTGSARLCERLGMRHEAHLVENDLDGDRWGSEYIYAALVHDLRRG